MRLTMVGAGYVGLVTGTCFANTGNDVICLDIDPRKIDSLKSGGCPIYEPGLTEMMQTNVKSGRLRFSTAAAEAYTHADVVFICVGTPSDDAGRADLKYVFEAAEEIAAAIKVRDRSRPPMVVVVKSTVPVGTTLEVKDRIRRKVGAIPFDVANNPEFLKEGAAIADFLRPDRVVCGVENERAADIMRDLYEPYVRQGNPIFVMDVASSEMVKYASNAMLATKISFINEMATLCDALGADIGKVREGMCADRRIGNQFLYPGLGYGGSCFPKDVLACIAMGEKVGRPTRLLTGVHEVNQRQRETFFSKIAGHFEAKGGLQGKVLAFWGIAFKPNTDDIREAPSLTLMQAALRSGAKVRAHDPVAAENASRQMGRTIELFQNMYDATTGADALVISTDWDEFKSPDFERVRKAMRAPVVFDGRNLYRASQMARHGFTYYSVGRAVARPV